MSIEPYRATKISDEPIELYFGTSELSKLIHDGKLNHALNLAVILLGFQHGKLKWNDALIKGKV